jgi:hypothetical protein
MEAAPNQPLDFASRQLSHERSKVAVAVVNSGLHVFPSPRHIEPLLLKETAVSFNCAGRYESFFPRLRH